MKFFKNVMGPHATSSFLQNDYDVTIRQGLGEKGHSLMKVAGEGVRH